MIIFGICSAINGYYKGIYSIKERFEQTIKTINSIKRLNCDHYIILCDNSFLPKEYKEILTSMVNVFISLDNTMNDKSQSEAYQMIQIINKIADLQYDIFLKISGRYYLTDNFNIKNYDNDKINFREFNNICYSTVLYSFTKKNETFMKNTFEQFIVKSHYADIEHGLFNMINTAVNKIEYLGVAGNIAPSGEYIEH